MLNAQRGMLNAQSTSNCQCATPKTEQTMRDSFARAFPAHLTLLARPALLAFLALLALPALVWAQGKPDFSGTWKLSGTTPPNYPGSAGWGVPSPTLVVKQTSTDVTIQAG